jgi:hypothetical protein
MAIPKTYSPELIENGRRRYEETDEPLTSIAPDFGVHPRTLRKYIERWGWTKRSRRPPRTLSPVMQLLEEARHVLPPEEMARKPSADAIPSQVIGGAGITKSRSTAASPAAAPPTIAPPTIASAPAAPAPAAPAPAAGTEVSAAPALDAAQATDPAPLVERLLHAVANELSTVEAMRAHQGAAPQAPADAERTARTLESLTRTLREAQRLRGAATNPAGLDADDMPRDIDEFRLDLARRIDAFVASRTDAGPRDGDEPAGGDPPRA